MISQTFVTAFNHLLSQAPWARERLMAHTGRHACIEAGGLRLRFEITADGYTAATAPTDSCAPDVALNLPADALPRAFRGMDELMSGVHISGNAEFADALGFVLRNLRWNSEEDLSRLVGDLAAHRVDRTLRAALAFPPRLAGSMLRGLKDYLVDERPTLVEKEALPPLTRELAELRDDLARLEKRLERLER